jgi:Sphingosine kinase and enzymes related to eukaryotic diacylglycerol kinase
MTGPVPVIFNPVAGRGRLLHQRGPLEAAAERVGIRLDWWPTEAPGHAVELARRAAAARRDLVFAFGGDGTYNEVARGLLGSGTAMGLLPGGTTSVLAHELGIPRPAAEALGHLVGGEDRLMSVGRTDRGDIFLLMLSAGPDSVILSHLPEWLKRYGGKTGITFQAVFEFVRGGLPRVRVRSEDGWEVGGGWVIVGNSRCYGGPFYATPEADPFVPEFEIVVQQAVGRLAAVPFFFSIPSMRHLKRRDVVRRHVTRLVIEPAPGEESVPYQIDGDPAGVLPVEVWPEPARLKVRLPAASG